MVDADAGRVAHQRDDPAGVELVEKLGESPAGGWPQASPFDVTN